MAVQGALASSSKERGPNEKFARTEDLLEGMGAENNMLFTALTKFMKSDMDQRMEKVDNAMSAIAGATDAGFKDVKQEMDKEKKARKSAEAELERKIEQLQQGAGAPSNGKGKGKGKATKGSDNNGDDFKVKVTGFITDTRKADAEATLMKHCAKEEGFVETYMPHNRNDFAFIKFDSDSARRRFLNKTYSEELIIVHDEKKLRFNRCRTLEQKSKTKHVDKCFRAILEEIQSKHNNTDDKDLKDKVESGMKDGGVLWIGGVRVAEMKIKAEGVGTKEFVVDANKITEETKKQGWPIDGESVLANYHRLMDQ